MVVYVVETCETHLLERAWSDALAADDMAPIALGNGDLDDRNLAMTASHVQSLIDLKIVDPVS